MTPSKSGKGNGSEGPTAGKAGPVPASSAKAAARGVPVVQRVTEQVDTARLPYRAALAGLGLVAALYLTILHFTSGSALGCSEGHLINCTAVLTSPESTLLGIPVAAFGLVFFLIYLATLYVRRQRSSPMQSVFALVWALGGGVVVMVLLYTELFVVNRICLWCSFTHLMAMGLFVLEIWPTGAGDDVRADARRRARQAATRPARH